MVVNVTFISVLQKKTSTTEVLEKLDQVNIYNNVMLYRVSVRALTLLLKHY